MELTKKHLYRLKQEEELTFYFDESKKEITVIRNKDFVDLTEKDDNDWRFKTEKDNENYNNLIDEEQDQLKERLADDYEDSSKAWIMKLCERLQELDPDYYSDDMYADLDDWFKSYFG